MRKTLAFCIALSLSAAAFAQTLANPALKIVVIEGEDAVNIIQQKTAVAPVIEVRDRNNLPVSGATVTFAISGQGASFAGAPTVTVVTNAAGQATAAGLTPTTAGAIHISATATFEGQTAVATIAQSNVVTAAEAVGSTTGAGGGSTTGSTAGAAGGTGGGLSGATLGIIGAVAGGGALVAAKAAGGGGDSPTASTPTATAPATTPTTTTPTTPTPTPNPSSASTFSGPVDGNFQGTSSVTIVGEPGSTCQFGVKQTGTATIKLQTASGGAISGTLDLNGVNTFTVSSCTGDLIFPLPPQEPFAYSAPVDGSSGTVRFNQDFHDSGSVPGATYTVTAATSFTGTVSSSGVTGTLTYNSVADIRGDGFSSKATWTGTVPLTLR